ncbi:MAG: Fic family protein [Ancrocorticia sp.]|uniref:Fic family protein n=1 Tax=Ancrocorticia sp. TaxID=2593684 RepID=UPI003F9038CB
MSPGTSPEVIGLAEHASRELTAFDAEQGTRMSHFAPVLLRSEAAASSQIENLTASARSIFSADVGIKTGENAKMIASNTQAMSAALSLAESISTHSILAMHEVLMANQPQHTPGAFRTEPVWIGTSGTSPIHAEYVAPKYERIPQLIDDLVVFANRLDVSALISVAVTHAQFETIHPFTDGNGRTGRALVSSMLRHRGILRNVAVPVSAGLLADVNGYHQALTAYRAGEVSPIVEAFSTAALRAVHNSRLLLHDIDQIRVSWEERLHARRDSNAWKLLDVLTQTPILNSRMAAERLGVAQSNVYAPLRTLTDAGILQSKHEHRMGPFWRSEEVLNAIDTFAERSGRRELPEL